MGSDRKENGNGRPRGTQRPWHALATDEVLAALAAEAGGLDSEEAQRRLARHGPNRLRPPDRNGPLKRFLLQFHNLLIYVLLAAGVGTTLLGHLVDSGVIFGVVVINAVIGFIQEGKAERALEAIRNMLSQQALVRRDGAPQELPAEELVPGDVVLLQSGDKVPADLRLLQVRDLRVDESILTGESLPAEKGTAAVAPDALAGDRACLAFSGTFVTYGKGTGVVVETGDATEIGRINRLLREVQVLTTPLLRKMAEFARTLTFAIGGVALLTFLFGVFARDYTVTEMFLSAVGLAVAAIPEGLPAIMTITLAIGVQRMARRHAIIRRLPAVETLGAVTVICSDKTGTLTRNEMSARSVVTGDRLYEVSGAGYAPHGGFSADHVSVEPEGEANLMELCRAVLLCNDASVTQKKKGGWRMQGDPTEGALVTLALKAGLDPERERQEYTRLDTIPFESERQFMASLHHDLAGHRYIYLKGAPERVLERCARQWSRGEERPLDVRLWHARLDALAAQGQRMLAVAVRPLGTRRHTLTVEETEGGFTLLGAVGLMDPPRDEAVQAVARCHRAGIRVKMITGDHAVTAHAIGAQLGLGEGTPLTGHELDAMDDAALRVAVREASVFARTTPEHKLRLVEALQAQGEVVAMTGDGVNDAPALKRADVGVAMGRKGTEVSKEAAEMVLADDNFASIAHAVEEGRTVYDNLKKAILFILPTNGGEALIIVAAIALGRMLPVTAAQILWVNMITAVTLALALAFEPAEHDIMQRAPRVPSEPLLSRFMLWRIVFVSLLMVAGAFGLFLFERWNGAAIEAARTVAVNTLVVAEAFYLLNSRFLTDSVLNRRGLLGNRWALVAIVIVMVFQLLFTYLPLMQLFFKTAPLGVDAWLRVVTVGLMIFYAVELEKRVVRWRCRRRSAGVDDGEC